MDRRSLLAGAALGFGMPAMGAVETVSGKSRLRSALCAYSFRNDLQSKKVSYEDLVRKAVEWNIDGLDLTVYWFPSKNDDFLMPLKRLAYRNGIEIYSISIRTNFCQPSPDLQEKELVELKSWIDVAAKLGAGHIRVFGGTVPKGRTEDEAAGWVASILQRGCDYAGSKGIILGLENHGGITSKAERIVEIVKKVDSPWVGVNLDTGNFESDAYNQLAICLPYSVNVQVKENIKVTKTQEKSDWARIVGMLNKAGYKGYLALEYEEKEAPEVAVPRLLAKLKQVIGQG